MADTVATANPGKLVVMLYDQMLVDLRTADAAFDLPQYKAVEPIHRSLMHVWETLRYLRRSLNTEIWDGAPRLYSLYAHMENEINLANLYKDRERVQRVQGMISQLADAWRIAAERPLDNASLGVVGVA
jgi:flagellar protein FliS